MHRLPLRFPFLLCVSLLAAAFAAWAALRFKTQLWMWTSIGFSTVAALNTLGLLRRRQVQALRNFSWLAWLRLSIFALTVILALVSTTTAGLAYQRAYALVHPRRGYVRSALEEVGIPALRAVNFQTPDGLALYGWYAPTQNGATVILLHGHGSTREAVVSHAALLAGQGYGVLLYDARNSGESQGTASSFGFYEWQDVQGAVNFLQAQPEVDADRIGVFGRSAGAGTTILAAARTPQIKVIVAESAFASLEANIQNGVEKLAGLPAWPFAPLVVFFGERESGATIAQVQPVIDIASLSPRPVLLLHGAADDIIPVQNAYQLYAAAQQPKELYVVPNAGHLGVLQTGGEAYAQRLIGFFDKYLDGQ